MYNHQPRDLARRTRTRQRDHAQDSNRRGGARYTISYAYVHV